MRVKRAVPALIVMASAMLASTAASAADYVIDAKNAHASINFRVKHLGFSWLTGRFNTFSGTFSFDEDAPEKSKVSVEIDTASVDSNHGERDNHLRGEDFLAVEEFPKATFESTKVELDGDGKAKITGNLTLRGVTKEVVIDAEHIGGGEDPWRGYRDGFAGTTSFELADFEIPKDLGPAAKTVELQLHIEGIRQ